MVKTASLEALKAHSPSVLSLNGSILSYFKHLWNPWQ